MNEAMEVWWLKLTFSTKMQLCVKCKGLLKVFILRRGVVFTSEVGMTRVNRRWKAYPARKEDK